MYSYRIIFPLTLLIGFLLFGACTPQPPIRVLVFSKTTKFRHKSIEKGVETLHKLGQVNGFEVVATEDANALQEESLRDFSAVIFLNNSGDALNPSQQTDLQRYIQAGGGFVGVHGASTLEYDWPWYGELLGAYFDKHPKVQSATLHTTENKHLSTDHLPEAWTIEDEWYNFKYLNPDVTVVLTIDEKSYEGGTHGDFHPMAWYHEYDGGRSFYTELGHTHEIYDDPNYLKHLLGGIQYAVGNNQRDYSLARYDRIPLENRFVRTVLTQNLEEPMEVDVLDENHLIFIQRHGAIFTYDLEANRLDSVTKVPVFSKLEEGLIGLAVDPNYAENNWIYLFYSDPGSQPIQHVSRFIFKDNQLDYASEKILLTVATQRDQCCHSGGSMEFGPDGSLYISTGDNTNPFASDGFAPADERPGRSPWDAQKSAANTNDLRGKVLRIKPEANGTYSIPAGNLFPEGTDKTRPEIFVMGCRNPFRISVDQKTGFLYWGDVGPDAGKTKDERGPKGHDELNQARQAGFWGWPYTRGNNKAYVDYDFASKVSGERRNPQQLINDSPNNTGLLELPPAQSSMIWYSYDRSAEFPWMGTGGKNPMAGPAFHTNLHTTPTNGFPDYFDGKLFFYDWMRDWIFVITMDENHQYEKADPFMPSTDFGNPVDMVFGKDGNLYLLEYGEKWNSRNLDARLNKIEFIAGNRAPAARITTDKIVGAVPMAVQVSAANSEDFDGDPLTYSWKLKQGAVEGSGLDHTFTFEEEGIYQIQLTVSDSDGQEAVATQEILVGNASPEITIDVQGENDFFWKGKSLDYTIKVTDNEDGSTVDGSIVPSNVQASLTYIPEGYDLAGATIGHQQQDPGLVRINGSDCKSCHGANERINGPSYEQIAGRYSSADIEYLSKKIITGGGGVWDETVMPAHPQHTAEEVREMVKYILSVGKTVEVSRSIALSGTETLTDHVRKNQSGRYVMLVSYTDQGGGPISPLSAQEQYILRSPRLEAEDYDEASPEITKHDPDGISAIGMVSHNRYIMYKKLGLEGLTAVSVDTYFDKNYAYAGAVEIRLDSRDGELIGETSWKYEAPKKSHPTYRIPVKPVSGRHDLYFVFKNAEDREKIIANVDGFELIFK